MQLHGCPEAGGYINSSWWWRLAPNANKAASGLVLRLLKWWTWRHRSFFLRRCYLYHRCLPYLSFANFSITTNHLVTEVLSFTKRCGYGFTGLESPHVFFFHIFQVVFFFPVKKCLSKNTPQKTYPASLPTSPLAPRSLPCSATVEKPWRRWHMQHSRSVLAVPQSLPYLP